MRKLLLALLLLTLIVGCAHQSTPTVCISQPKLSWFTERALAAVRSKESVRLPDGGLVGVWGDYDPTKPIRYEFLAGKEPRVAVQIPMKNSMGDSYTVIDFNSYSGVIIEVSRLMIRP